METWSRKDNPEEIKVGWRHLVRKVFSDPNGMEREYYTKERIGSIAIATIALTSQNRVIVAEQFRPGPEEVLEELPGGGHEPGESLELAARRELHEETGYAPGQMEYLGKVYKDAYTNTAWHFFLARDCVKDGDQHTDDGEFINVKEISIAQLFENARNAKMTDTDAVFLAYEKLKELEANL
jgi:ADP-ribose pyrophosphatase